MNLHLVTFCTSTKIEDTIILTSEQLKLHITQIEGDSYFSLLNQFVKAQYVKVMGLNAWYDFSNPRVVPLPSD